MRKITYPLIALGLLAAFLLAAQVALARCLDEDCRPVWPTASPTWAPLWTATPAATEIPPATALESAMATDMPAPPEPTALSGYPAPPETATPPGGYPGQLPSPTATATLPPDCQIDWSQPYSDEALRSLIRALSGCIRAILLNGGYGSYGGHPLAAACPPPGSLWGPYFSSVCPQAPATP